MDIKRAALIAKLRFYGIKYPRKTLRAAEATGVPLWALCAFLEQESSGGANVFGHDPTIFIGAGTVTEEKYKAYLAKRKASGNRLMQGVGPMQLTWWEFQDGADALGGCWKPEFNILYGAQLLRKYYDAAFEYRGDDENGRWRYAAYKYNGKQSYVDSIQPKFDKWKPRFPA